MHKALILFSFSIISPLVFILFIITIVSGIYNQKSSTPFLKFDLHYKLFQSFNETTQLQNQASTQSVDSRSKLIEKFYTKYNSPLASLSEHIVQQADKYHIDYRLLPSISMQESTGCKFIPENSYNCWGYGIYGDKVLRFESYAHGIERVSRAIRQDYYNHGLDTPLKIMRKYTPPSIPIGGVWAQGVGYFFSEIEDP